MLVRRLLRSVAAAARPPVAPTHTCACVISAAAGPACAHPGDTFRHLHRYATASTRGATTPLPPHTRRSFATGTANDAAASGGKRGATAVSVVKDFRALRGHFKAFVLRVHPDVVHHHDDNVRVTNQRSLAELTSLVDSIEVAASRHVAGSGSAAGAAGGGSTARAPELPSATVSLKFYCEKAPAATKATTTGSPAAAGAASPAAALTSFTYRVALPRDLVAMSMAPPPPPAELAVATSAAARRGSDLQARWLAFATSTVQGLLSRVGVDTPLASPLQVKAGQAGVGAKEPAWMKAVRRRQSVGRDGSDGGGVLEGLATSVYGDIRAEVTRAQRTAASQSPDDLLRDNLFAESPIAQGKAQYNPPPQMNAPSLFDEKERVRRVAMLFDKGAVRWQGPCSGGDAATAAELAALARSGGGGGGGGGSGGIESTVARQKDLRRAHVSLRRLSQAMVRWYDGMDLYHELWSGGLRLVLTASEARGLYSDLDTRSIYLPYDYDDKEMVHFVRDAFRSQLSVAQERAKRLAKQHARERSGARRASEAAARRGGHAAEGLHERARRAARGPDVPDGDAMGAAHKAQQRE